MKSDYIKIIFFFFTVTIVSCTKENTILKPNLGYTYFPVNVGHYVIYDVDSIYKDDFSGLVTYGKYQIKEVIESEFIDNSGRITYRIERYRKDTAVYPDWTIYNVWTANLTPTVAERFENNVRYIKLVFPVMLGETWNGNSMNTGVEEDYEYTEVNEGLSINNLTFDSVATVLQADELDNLAEPKYKEEKYAAGVGLIYRKNYIITTKTNPQTGVLDTASYISYTEQISSYGN